MYKIDQSTNRLLRLQEKSFSELNFREREHLQEWLANMPDTLGEDLLIIQKEFDGFDQTREHLDLLAIDKNAQLVVIENKLDDCGRDVVWQALKYATYVSKLNKSQVTEVFQQYLDRYCGGGSASNQLADFLEVDDLDEVVLNSGSSQRIVFVAANFRKEVTATALWLLSNGISLRCFKATPYAFGEELLLDIKQIIPTPEAEEYMIGMSTKAVEEKTTLDVSRIRYHRRAEFWETILELFEDAGIELFRNMSPGKENWISVGSGVSSCPYMMVFNKNLVRVEVWIGKASGDKNNLIFDALYSEKETIEARFGASLDWRRMDSKKSSRIIFEHSIDTLNRENWPEIIAWFMERVPKLEEAFSEPLKASAMAAKK